MKNNDCFFKKLKFNKCTICNHKIYLTKIKYNYNFLICEKCDEIFIYYNFDIKKYKIVGSNIVNIFFGKAEVQDEQNPRLKIDYNNIYIVIGDEEFIYTTMSDDIIIDDNFIQSIKDKLLFL